MLPSLDFKWWLLGGSRHYPTWFCWCMGYKPLLDTWGHAPCKDVLSNYTGSSPYFGTVGSDTLFCGTKWSKLNVPTFQQSKYPQKYIHQSTTKACLKPPSLCPEFCLGESALSIFWASPWLKVVGDSASKACRTCFNFARALVDSPSMIFGQVGNLEVKKLVRKQL